MRKLAFFPAVLLTFALSMCAFSAQAKDASNHISAKDKAAFKHFKLSESFLQKYFAVSEDSAKDPCHLSMVFALKGADKKKLTSLDQVADYYDSRPGVHAMLAKHDITARHLLLGMGTMMSAAVQEMKAENPKFAKHIHGSNVPVSDANMAFYKAHKEEIHKRMKKIGKKMLADNGGKMPSCFSGK